MNDLLKPIHADKVAGNNIEYDEEFLSLLALLQDKPEQQFGDVVVEASAKDWNAIHQACINILTNKSKDLLVMSYFTQSAITLHGIQGFKEGLYIIANNLKHFWTDVYPNLTDEDGEYDPDFRINALSLFFTYDGLIRELKNSPLIANGLSGRFYQLREIEDLLEGQPIDYPGGTQRLAVDIKIALDDKNSPASHLQHAYQLIQEIKAIFQENEIYAPLKFDTLEQLIQKILVQSESDETASSSTSTNTSNTFNSAQALTSSEIQVKQNWANYQVSSREDAEFLLEKICKYFEKHEPSHPAPLFIRRIQKLMNLNFYEIMRDISPESLDRLDNLVGQPITDDDN